MIDNIYQIKTNRNQKFLRHNGFPDQHTGIFAAAAPNRDICSHVRA